MVCRLLFLVSEMNASTGADNPRSRAVWAQKPVLSLPPTREELTAWLQWNDRDGVYTDYACECEGAEPMDMEEAVDAFLDAVDPADPGPSLMSYDGGVYLRGATQDELQASLQAAELDGGHGVILVNGLPCYVEG